jgi:hypothetical protein
MIGQYLPNNNEKSYSAVLQKILHLKQPLVAPKLWRSGWPKLSTKVQDGIAEFIRYYSLHALSLTCFSSLTRISVPNLFTIMHRLKNSTQGMLREKQDQQTNIIAQLCRARGCYPLILSSARTKQSLEGQLTDCLTVN